MVCCPHHIVVNIDLPLDGFGATIHKQQVTMKPGKFYDVETCIKVNFFVITTSSSIVCHIKNRDTFFYLLLLSLSAKLSLAFENMFFSIY